MSLFRAAVIRTAALVLVGGLGLSACATRQYVDEQISGVNSRIDALDARVQDAASRADAAGVDARTANQRMDQMEGRVNALERAPVRTPRG